MAGAYRTDLPRSATPSAAASCCPRSTSLSKASKSIPDLWLQYRAVLVLARAGSTAEALRRFDAFGLSSVDDAEVRALRARIARTRPSRPTVTDGAGRRHVRRRCTEHSRCDGGYYPGINSATLLVDRRRPRRRELATLVLGSLGREDVDSYFVSATEAEAALLLGRLDPARVALARAARLHHGNYPPRSATMMATGLALCPTLELDTDLLLSWPGRRLCTSAATGSPRMERPTGSPQRRNRPSLPGSPRRSMRIRRASPTARSRVAQTSCSPRLS